MDNIQFTIRAICFIYNDYFSGQASALWLFYIYSCCFDVIHIADTSHLAFKKCSDTNRIFATIRSLHVMLKSIWCNCGHQRVNLKLHLKSWCILLNEQEAFIKFRYFSFYNIHVWFNLPFFHQLLFLRKEPQSDTKIPLFLRATVAWNSMFYRQLLLRSPKAWIDFLIFWKNDINEFYASDVNHYLEYFRKLEKFHLPNYIAYSQGRHKRVKVFTFCHLPFSKYIRIDVTCHTCLMRCENEIAEIIQNG